MKKKILIAAIMALALVGFLPAKVLAAELGKDPVCDISMDDATRAAAGCDDTGDSTQVWTTVQTILDIVIAILGLIAVLFVVIGAAQYMTSQGDPGKTKKAKDTIVYAVLGVILASLAFTIVNFVLANIFGKSS